MDGPVYGNEGQPATWAGRVLHTLTQPLPRHIADFRESARTLLVFVALTICLITMWLPQRGEVQIEAALVIAGTVGLLGIAGLVPMFHPMLNRIGGLILLVQISAVLYVTGGPDSIYTPLLIMLLLYAAIFYGTARLVLTSVAVAAALVAPYIYGGMDPAHLSQVLVQVPIWLVTTGTIHWLVARIRMSAQTDGLTGLWNHVTFWQLLWAEHERMERGGDQYSVLLIDLDHFKKVNDTKGHRTGDEVLRSVSHLLKSRCRRSDVVARYGGEEFAILLPATDVSTAAALAKELRLRVLTTTMATPVTVSVGVASSAMPGIRSPEAVVSAADAALYRAKAGGRNMVVVHADDAPSMATTG